MMRQSKVWYAIYYLKHWGDFILAEVERSLRCIVKQERSTDSWVYKYSFTGRFIRAFICKISGGKGNKGLLLRSRSSSLG